MWLSSMGGLVHQLKELLNEHVRQCCNIVAHKLARSGAICQGIVVFDLGALPACIQVLVVSDLAGSQV